MRTKKRKNEAAVLPAMLCVLAAAIALCIYLSSCGARAAGNAYALEVTGPPGFRCFAIMSEAGAPVGGNCIAQ